MYRLLQTSFNANFVLEIQVTRMSMSNTLTFWIVCHKIWNYEGLSMRPNFVTGFVDPIVNTGILIKSDIIFVDEYYKMRYCYLLLQPGRSPSNGVSEVIPGFSLKKIEILNGEIYLYQDINPGKTSGSPLDGERSG